MAKINPAKLRNKLGLTQQEFYSRIELSQSCGSRLETRRRRISKPVQALIDIAFGDERTSTRTVKRLRGARA